MNTPTRIAVTGASGRMGRTILKLLIEDPDVELAGACDLPTSRLATKDIGEWLGTDHVGLSIQYDLAVILKKGADAVIDFTSPESTVAFAKAAALHGVPLVIGTTGLSDDQKREIAACAKKIPIVMSPNMSIGVNVLFKLIEDAVALLGAGYDVEVIEAHHRLKKDSPSGTAVRMAEVLARARGLNYPDDICFHRQGIIGERPEHEIGMQTIRGGDIVGEHTAMFCGIGERLEIKHVATSRETFARGAIRAAKWISGKSPRLYEMRDVLGLPAPV